MAQKAEKMLLKIINEWLCNVQLFPKVWIIEILIKAFRTSGFVSGSRFKAVFGYPYPVENSLSCRISNRQTGWWSSLVHICWAGGHRARLWETPYVGNTLRRSRFWGIYTWWNLCPTSGEFIPYFCVIYTHSICVGMSNDQYEIFRDDYDRHNVLQWLCDSCKEQNKETNQPSEMHINHMGQDERLKQNQKKSWFGISKNCKMEKNYIKIPRGKAGKTLIAEETRLIRLFNSNKRWESVAIHMLQVLLPLLLQKPSLKSKHREHVKCLNKRMEWICHNIHKDKAQICSSEEHPCCNTRILRQTKWCPPPRPHGHWLQHNS